MRTGEDEKARKNFQLEGVSRGDGGMQGHSWAGRVHGTWLKGIIRRDSRRQGVGKVGGIIGGDGDEEDSESECVDSFAKYCVYL